MPTIGIGAAMLAGSVISGGIGAANFFSQRSTQRQTWNREDNAVQRRMADLQQAGLSPTLAAGNPAGSANTQAPQISEFKGFEKAAAIQMVREKKIHGDLLDEQVALAQQDKIIKDVIAQEHRTNVQTMQHNLTIAQRRNMSTHESPGHLIQGIEYASRIAKDLFDRFGGQVATGMAELGKAVADGLMTPITAFNEAMKKFTGFGADFREQSREYLFEMGNPTEETIQQRGTSERGSPGPETRPRGQTEVGDGVYR